ncbi:MAG: hypothetical protein H6831_02930 [Planctomycetes bacterium]|nr:hypothetical protein [Planctomycetota bacterium]
MFRGLALLHLRRGLRPWMFVALGALAALVLTSDPPRALVGESMPAGAWRRRELWSVALLVCWPAALLHAASLVPRWRAGELDWLAPRVSGLGRALAASWCGTLAAMLSAVLLVAALAEATSGPAPALVDRGFRAGVELEAANPRSSRRWSVELPATDPGSRLAVDVAPRVYRGPTVDALLTVERGDARTLWTGRVGRAQEVLLDLPPGEGPAVLTLECVSDGAALSAPQVGARLWARAERLDGASGLFGRVALAAALSLALALGFGAWVSAASALFAVGALWTVVWLGDAPWPLPASDLFAVLDDLGRGRAAGSVPLAAWWITLAGCVVGVGLARVGLARQRRSA